MNVSQKILETWDAFTNNLFFNKKNRTDEDIKKEIEDIKKIIQKEKRDIEGYFFIYVCNIIFILAAKLLLPMYSNDPKGKKVKKYFF